MSLIRLFVLRPVGTTLLALAMLIGGVLGYLNLPVAELPDMDFPVIMVIAQQPGGSPSEIASTIAEPLERHLGAISGVTEMTSQSTVNQTRILLQFDLARDINGAARDVEAALRSARQDLPTSLRSNPTYMKANSNGPPIMAFSLTSSTRTPQQLYAYASNVLLPQLSQVKGVGGAELHGGALPAVRVEVDPLRLFHYGIGFEDLRAALASANAHTPKGFLDSNGTRFTLATNDQATQAAAYRGLIVAYRNNQPVRLSDVAQVRDSVEDLRQAGYHNGQRSIFCLVFTQGGANIIKTIDDIKARLPVLKDALPGDTHLEVVLDHSTTIRASLADTKQTLVIAILLVILMVILFLRNVTAVLVPAIVVPVSIIATFGVMALMHYQIDNMSLMALTIATGFVVDDAIVVLENITRYMEMGHDRVEAAILGAEEVAFTVLSITLSLIVVFIPILLMQGLAGRLFHEFAVTMIITLVVSMVLSLTLTPMISAQFLTAAPTGTERPTLWTRSSRVLEAMIAGLQNAYDRSVAWVFRHSLLTVLSLPATLVLALALFVKIPKEFFPAQDQGILMGRIVADQTISFHALQKLTIDTQHAIAADPDVASVIGGLGGRSSNSVNLFITLKPQGERSDTLAQTQRRLNGKFRTMAGARLWLHPPSGVGGSARASDGAVQYALQGASAEELYEWTPRIVAALSRLPELSDVTSDIEQNGQAITVALNRDMQARYAITPQLVSNILFDAFGQRAASIIYGDLNQYRVILEAAPRYWANPEFLKQTWISVAGGTASGGTASNNLRVRAASNAGGAPLSQSELSYQNAMANALAGGRSASNGAAVTTSRETMVPLSVLAHLKRTNNPLAVNHQGQFVSATISFNLTPGTALGTAISAVQETLVGLHIPKTVQGGFVGSAANFQKSLGDEPLLILAALATVYIVLGILYESLIHPLTILSTLPSAGVGALLGLTLCGEPFSLMTLLSIILLIGIVKKNAILLVDFAITAQKRGADAAEAIREASHLRFRPILMTSLAAALGTVPLVVSGGYGHELHRPLGIAILGGLTVSQLLTLYTTPVLYLYLERLARMLGRLRARSAALLHFPARDTQV